LRNEYSSLAASTSINLWTCTFKQQLDTVYSVSIYTQLVESIKIELTKSIFIEIGKTRSTQPIFILQEKDEHKTLSFQHRMLLVYVIEVRIQLLTVCILTLVFS